MSFIRTKHQSFKHVFGGEQGKRVLGVLAKFCHVNTTTHVLNDARGSDILEGRRQVFLMISAMQESPVFTPSQSSFFNESEEEQFSYAEE